MNRKLKVMKNPNGDIEVAGVSVNNTQPEETKIKRQRPPVIPSPETNVSGRKPIKMTFHVGNQFASQTSFPHPDQRKRHTIVHHLYPLLSEWVGRSLPDGVNPRSHEPECLKSPVAKQIEQTIVDKPEDFFLANRGTTIIADHVEFDRKTGNVTVTISDPENQGIADGATTDAVLAKVQTRLAREIMDNKEGNYLQLIDLKKSSIPEILKNGRIHLEVIVGLEDRERIASLVQGRNTSRQVKGWSMENFRGAFEWVKNILEDEKSIFRGKIGYEENSSQDTNILDVLSLATLFHPEFDESDGGDKAPTVAYANKGRMDIRLADENLIKGYKGLAPILEDILKLHDHVYANFEYAYEKVFGAKARLGRREGIQSRLLGEPYELSLTGLKSNYVIPSGFIFPLLASFRALVSYKGGKAHWKVDPFEFFDKYGNKLVGELMEQVEAQGGNPNVAGKRKLVYTALHTKASLYLSKAQEK
jgi:hypothetical protein